MSVSGRARPVCQQGRLVAVNGARALIEVSPGRSCAACRAGRGCGMAIFSGWFARGPLRLAIPARPGWSAGDRIELRIAPATLVRLAWIAYGAPLALLIAGLGAGALVATLANLNPDLAAAVGGVLGLATGLLWMRAKGGLDLPLEASKE